jgi:ubiquinone/menaquinone biosynthesis C-methylase UbiE
MNSTLEGHATHLPASSGLKAAALPAPAPFPSRPRDGQPPTPERLLQYAWGYAPPLILGAALKFHLFDALEQSPATVDELAARTGASPRGLSAILNALTGLEFLAKRDGRYHLTPESSTFLVAGKPGFHGGFFEHTVDQVMAGWLQLPEVVRSGRPAVSVNQQNQGAEFFTKFVESLFPLSYQAATQAGEHLGIARAAEPVSILDIGAGSGVWGIALARQSAQARVRAVDWPQVLDVTRDIAQRHGVGDRFTFAPGDLMEADFGSGHQIATIGHILHSEGRERSRQLLRKVFMALAPGGTVVISEFMPDEDRSGPPTALIFAVNMLVHTENGDTFSFAEISDWLLEAGFRNRRLLEAAAPSPLVLATKP